MATLPENNLLQSGQITVQEQPSRTWYLDQTTGRIQGVVDRYEAVKQAVEIILNVERFRWQIYSPYSGMQWEGLIGRDPGYVVSELQRRIKDALLMDSRILGIKNFQYTINGDSLTASLVVSTVYGDVAAQPVFALRT